MGSLADHQKQPFGDYLDPIDSPYAACRHIVFVNSSLVCGGAERVIVLLTGCWARAGTRTTVITVHSPDRDHHQLDSRVGRVSLAENQEARNLYEGLRNNIRRIRKLRQAIRLLKPSAIISFQDTNNILTLISVFGLSLPVIVCERNDPRMRPLSPFRRTLRWLLYKSASALVVQTRSLLEWGSSMVGQGNVHVIPNPVGEASSNGSYAFQKDGPIVAVGRLVKQKGFDILLKAISLCEQDWQLEIIGDGPDRPNLELLAAELGVTDQVQFVGQVKDPREFFRSASLFVLSSRYEGFPNVLLEAMAFGLPVVSFDCPSGPSEIIRHGVDGVLVSPGNAEALSQAIDQLMVNSDLRSSFSKRAPDVLERFAADEILSRWDVLLGSVSKSAA